MLYILSYDIKSVYNFRLGTQGGVRVKHATHFNHLTLLLKYFG